MKKLTLTLLALSLSYAFAGNTPSCLDLSNTNWSGKDTRGNQSAMTVSFGLLQGDNNNVHGQINFYDDNILNQFSLSPEGGSPNCEITNDYVQVTYSTNWSGTSFQFTARLLLASGQLHVYGFSDGPTGDMQFDGTLNPSASQKQKDWQ